VVVEIIRGSRKCLNPSCCCCCWRAPGRFHDRGGRAPHGIGSGKAGLSVHEQTWRLRDDNQPYVVGVTSYNPAGDISPLFSLT